MMYARQWMVGVVAACLAAGAAGLMGAGPAEAPAPAADLAAATPVTLHLKDVAPEDAFGALAKAAGVKFGGADTMWDNKALPESVSLDVDAKPFWEVFAELSALSGVGPNPWMYGGGGRRITLVPIAQMGPNGASFSKRPHVIIGPFMLVANSISRNRTVDLANPSAITDNTNIQLSVMCEPRIRVGQISQFAISEAVDENGLSLLNANPNMMRMDSMSDVSRTWMFQSNANLVVPANAGKRIATLKGSLLLNVFTRMETFEVPDLGKAADVSKVIGGTKYTLQQAQPGKQADTWDVSLLVTQEKLLDVGPRQVGYAAVQASQLLDADGNAWQPGGAGGSGSTGNMTYKMTYYGNRGGGEKKPGVPVKFVMELPAEVKEVRIPVEFKDLPLP